eukprot:PhM_4_TR11780/c0_g1_i1/m.102041/K01847/MUT; methylmalonyl-CoA mutase
MGGMQSLHTNSFDEAVGLPTKTSSRIARNTQLVLQEETNLTKVVDPWAGSYMMENLTAQLVEEASKVIEEVDAAGGMTQAIVKGMPKRKIEESAARRQAAIDSGKETIVGVNKYRCADDVPVEVLKIDNTAVRNKQLDKLKAVKQARKQEDVDRCLKAITAAAQDAKNGNLLELSIEAARARCTLGEISTAIEEVVGRYAP